MSNIDTEYLTKSLKVDNEFLNKKGLCGLKNLGNSCYMNVIIHSLNRCYPLLNYLFTNEYKKHLNKSRPEHFLLVTLDNIMRSLYYKNSIVTPDKLYELVIILAKQNGYSDITANNHCDSHEFLQFLLEAIHKSVSHQVIMNIDGSPKNDIDNDAINALKQWRTTYQNDYSDIIDMFTGQFITRLTRQGDTKPYSTVYEPFNNLSLEIVDENGNQLTTLYECLNKFTQPDEIYDSSNNKACITRNFWNTPDTLIIFLKRFKYDTNSNRLKRINHNVEFSIDDVLDLSPYMKGYNRNKAKYRCFSVVHHLGNHLGGHYYNFVKNTDGNWYKFNDDIVSKSSTPIVSGNVYCMFYERI